MEFLKLVMIGLDMHQKIILFLLFALTTNVFPQKFTLEQKLKDFEYMYKVLNENYPYFGINKRKYNTDWLANKDKYIERIKNTKTDREYFNTLYDALGDLHSGHTDFYPTMAYYSWYEKAYIQAAKSNPIYKNWVKEMHKPAAKEYQPYWGAMLNPDQPTETVQNETAPQKVHYYPFSTSIIEKNKIACLKIPSLDLNYNNTAHIGDSIRRFLLSVKYYPNLIIDIQENGGGNSRFWSDSIVPFLISKKIQNKIIIAHRKGKYVRKFKWAMYLMSKGYKSLPSKSNYAPELSNSDFKFLITKKVITPKNSVGYTGHIYLLVDKKVFSSAEMFASFAKDTKWATVAGENTWGDGIGSDPIVVTLPETGLIFRFPSDMGLNADGGASEEFGTAPDIKLDGADANERLSQLTNYIRSQANR